MTFFDALKSEVSKHSPIGFSPLALTCAPQLAGAEEVEQAFPEALKGPILRRVQFQTVSRIDHLVDMIYDEFKSDFYPGEAVTVQTTNGSSLNGMVGERLHGVVRDKTCYPSKVLPDGTSSEPFCRYIVSLDEQPDSEAIVDDEHIYRDRRMFNKSVLRSFVKKTVTREAWNGAPWLVKHDVAEQYHIDTRVPPHLRYHHKLLERKHMQAQKRMQQPLEMNGVDNPFQAQGPVRLPELKPAPKSHKAKNQPQQPQQGQVPGGRGKQYANHEAAQLVHLSLSGQPFQAPASFRGYGGTVVTVRVSPEPAPPPPPPKYPIEDLQVESQGYVRPTLKFMCRDPPVEMDEKSPASEKILMKSVGPLLETWDTLNVYCEIFKLDSFTFDDFVEAMFAASEDAKIQLFDEIHCAVLKILVKSEAEGGNIEIQLPVLEDEEDGEEDEEEDEEDPEPDPEPEPKPAGRATRSSMAKMEAERLAAEAAAVEKETQQEPTIAHRADDVLKDFDWIAQLRKRAFKNGGWELIMVGLLHRLAKKDRYKASCDELLAQLAPPDVEATQETVRQHYALLDINYRVQALQIICMLTAETKSIRGYMEDCSEQMTAYRKEKIEWQRQRKQA